MNTSHNMSPEVDAYIQKFPIESQEVMNKVRSLIFENFPDAHESISYGMPAYKLEKKPLIYFAGYKTYLGLYAMPAAHAAFADKLSEFKHGKGSVQFPWNKDIPYDLVVQMVDFNKKKILENQ